MNIGKLLFGATVFAASISATAETEQQPALSLNGFNFSIGRVSFDEEVATEEGVEDSATYWRLGWQRQSGQALFGAGISGYLYSDDEGFDQYVEDSSGDEFTADSSAVAINMYFEGGYSHNLNENISLEILGGLEQVLSSERSIPNCSNCREEDIDLNAGLYVTPRIRFSTDGSFSFSMAYHQYLNGDTENGFSVDFAWRH